MRFRSANLLVAVILSSSPGFAWATAVRNLKSTHDQRACAALDVHITTQIEDFGAHRMVAAEDLATAAFQQIEARVLCVSGRVKDALDLYGRIDFPRCPEFPCIVFARRD
jgi:hypothetical protein